MASKTLSQEYEMSETDDSPMVPYRSVARFKRKDEHKHGSEDQFTKTKCEDFINDHITPSDQLKEITNIQTEEKLSVTDNVETCKSVDARGDHPKATQRNVVYMYSEDLIEKCNQMLKIPNRASLVSSLIQSYRLHQFCRVQEPRAATLDELCTFHSTEYLTFLQNLSEQEDVEKYDEEAQLYGLSYDCPAHPGVYEYTALVSGATLQAAQCLMDQTADVAINWYGGWHHGKKDSASGFCYTNDIVLGILKLREKFNRVLYIDLDLHHGDGVEDAFGATNKVMTVSVHKHALGFFPGTGSIKNVGYSKGKNYTVNIPLKDGVKEAEFAALVCRVLLKVKDKFEPEVVVCQCGADGLTGDPMESFNLTPQALGKCVYTLLSWKLPILLLGGGGYNHANTARCWTYLTGIAVGKKLPSVIPEHQYLMEYGPDYELEMSPGNMRNHNTQEYLQAIYSEILYNLSQLP